MSKHSSFFLDGDGSSAILDKELLVAVSPLYKDEEGAGEGISISKEAAQQILKVMPKRTAAIEEKLIERGQAQDDGYVKLTMNSSGRVHTVKCSNLHDYDPTWRLVLRRLYRQASQGSKFSLSYKDLKKALDIVKELTGSADTALYFELADQLLLVRALSHETGQHVTIGLPRIHSTNDTWLRDNEWEHAIKSLSARIAQPDTSTGSVLLRRDLK